MQQFDRTIPRDAVPTVPLGTYAKFAAASSRDGLLDTARSYLLGVDLADKRRRSLAREARCRAYDREVGSGQAAAMVPPIPLAHRLLNCRRVSRASDRSVGIAGSESGTWYTELQTCGSAWACPECGFRIAEHRRAELAEALDIWRRGGGVVILVTLTAAHTPTAPLAPLLDSLVQAVRSMRGSRAFRALVRSNEVVGSVRATEVTHGRGGWHPHFHELWFARADVDVAALQHAVTACWLAALAKQSLTGLAGIAVDVRESSLSVDDYVTKFGRDRAWDVDAELTQGARKRSSKGRSAFDLLRVADDPAASPTDVLAARNLYVEYVAATYGRHQLQWSRGLRLALGLVPVVSDEEIASAEPAGSEIVRIPASDYAVVVANGARPALLAAVKEGGPSVVREFVDSLTPIPAIDRRSFRRHKRRIPYDYFEHQLMYIDLMVAAD